LQVVYVSVLVLRSFAAKGLRKDLPMLLLSFAPFAAAACTLSVAPHLTEVGAPRTGVGAPHGCVCAAHLWVWVWVHCLSSGVGAPHLAKVGAPLISVSSCQPSYHYVQPTRS